MKISAHYYGLLVLLLVGSGIAWWHREAYTLEAVTAWVQHLSSQKPFTVAGLYSLAPTLHLWGEVSPVAEDALCGTILGTLLLLMGTTVGVMVACLMVRYLAGVWRVPRLLGLWQRSSSQVS